MNRKNITVNKDSNLLIYKTHNLLSVTNKILSRSRAINNIKKESWMYRFWKWADDNNIPELEKIKVHNSNNYYLSGIPRNKEKLINLKELSLRNCNLKDIPSEIGFLVNLEKIDINENYIIELPLEITALINLTKLSIYNNNLILNEKQKKWIIYLKLKGCYVYYYIPKGIDYKNHKKKQKNSVYLKNKYISDDPINKIKSKDGILAWEDNETGLIWDAARINRGSNKGLPDTSIPRELNYLMYAGFNDWRVPTLYELETISTKINSNNKSLYIKYPLLETAADSYWGSNINRKKNSNVYCKNFRKNCVSVDRYYKDDSLYAGTLCVRNYINSHSLSWVNELCKWVEKENITYFPVLEEEIINLTEFIIRSHEKCYINNLPKEIGNLTNLTELRIADQKWTEKKTEFPSEIGNIVNLKKLDISNNNLIKLPKEIINLVNLTELNISNNPDLFLSTEQKLWIKGLKYKHCNIIVDDNFFNKKTISENTVVRENSRMFSNKISDSQDTVIEFNDNILAWIDKDTGLMWEVKNENNIDDMYIWDEEFDDDIWVLNDDIKDIFNYVIYFNESNYAGFSDWRLPTIDELKSLCFQSNIKNPLIKNNRNFYWTNAESKQHIKLAYYSYLRSLEKYDYKGGGSALYSKSFPMYVRCVRTADI